MQRIQVGERQDWRALAEEYGFNFHTMFGQAYWKESVYYQFTLEQIEDDLESPTAELHQMCLEVVDRVVRDEQLLERFRIPRLGWDAIGESWQRRDKSLYSRLDLAYGGSGPAKLFENNADTPTSLYETGFWQWLWLEDGIRTGRIPAAADQFNLLQEKLVERFATMAADCPGTVLHFSCCQGSDEDRGTVQYLEDCANEVGIATKFVFVEDIGLGEGGYFTDLDDQVITWMFKLYPWEFMLREEFGAHLLAADVNWIEPPWKAILSNKALLPMLWQMFPRHPNLLPAYFEDDSARAELSSFVKKPIFAREGANISVVDKGKEIHVSDGPYGEEGYIFQAFQPLPKFGEHYTLIGSWLVDDYPAGISVREDTNIITQDLSCYVPHLILE